MMSERGIPQHHLKSNACMHAQGGASVGVPDGEDSCPKYNLNNAETARVEMVSSKITV